jgi:hypothetical protein
MDSPADCKRISRVPGMVLTVVVAVLVIGLIGMKASKYFLLFDAGVLVQFIIERTVDYFERR